MDHIKIKRDPKNPCPVDFCLENMERFVKDYPDRYGLRNGVVYSREARWAIYVYRTEKGMISCRQL